MKVTSILPSLFTILVVLCSYSGGRMTTTLSTNGTGAGARNTVQASSPGGPVAWAPFKDSFTTTEDIVPSNQPFQYSSRNLSHSHCPSHNSWNDAFLVFRFRRSLPQNGRCPWRPDTLLLESNVNLMLSLLVTCDTFVDCDRATQPAAGWHLLPTRL